MVQPTTPRTLALSQALYRALLRAYPSAFRREHGAAMAQLFRDSCRDAYQERGVVGLFSVWRHTLGDLGVSALRERRAALIAAIRLAIGRHPSGPTWAAPPPALGALLGVLPVAQTRRLGRWSLACLSVEHWAGACIASFTVRWQASPDSPFPLLGLIVRVTDDRGGRYLARQRGGSGGSDDVSGHMDLAYTFTPTLDPAARVLHFAVRLQLLAQEGSPTRLVPLRTEPGGWDFTVAVPAAAAVAP